MMEYLRFGELYAIPSSNGLSRPSAVRGAGYKMVNMGELFSNGIINDIPMERVQMSDKELSKFLLEKGDLLFARQSLVAEGAGKCSYVNDLTEETTFESHLIRVRLNPKRAISKYFYYLFQLPNNPIKTIVNQCAQAGIRGSELVRVKVPCPSIKVQKKIASILSAYDSQIENNQKRIKLLEQMAENLYKEWFVRFRFPGYENAEFEGGVPKGWEYKPLGEIASFERGISYSSEEIDCEDGLNLVNLKNIEAFGGYRRDGLKHYNGKYKTAQVVKKGDLVMGVTDMTQDRRTVGAVALIPEIQGTSVISADLVNIVSKQPNLFLYCLCRFGNYSKFFSQFANGANVLHLKPNTLLNKKVLMPTEHLIKMFVENVQASIECIDNLYKQNDFLTHQRDLLLPRLMSGKLSI